MPDAIHRKLLTEQAHKLKGAFASIGLLRLQQLAELAQTDNGGDWEAGIADWLAEIDQHWQSDLALLKSKFDG